MRFKVGDKVKAISNNYGVTTKSNNWIGIITRVDNDDEQWFDAKTTACEEIEHIGDTFYSLNSIDFELIGNFTINDLEFADIITLRNGERYVLVEDTMYGEDSCYDCDCDNIGDYNNDGTRRYGNKNYDIMKVERNGKVIFERDETVREMTVKEISKALGYDVKIVKEREE